MSRSAHWHLWSECRWLGQRSSVWRQTSLPLASLQRRQDNHSRLFEAGRQFLKLEPTTFLQPNTRRTSDASWLGARVRRRGRTGRQDLDIVLSAREAGYPCDSTYARSPRRVFCPLEPDSLLKVISDREFLRAPIERLVTSIESRLEPSLPKLFRKSTPGQRGRPE